MNTDMNKEQTMEENRVAKQASAQAAQSEASPADAGTPPLSASEAVSIPPKEDYTAEQIEEFRKEAAKTAEHWDQLLRTTAEFDNYKKRAARDRQDAIRYANEGLLQKLVTILDNFEMALAAVNQSQQAPSLESLQTGVNMIHAQLKNVLAESGLEVIDASGQPFDPNWHEAVSQQETADVPEGTVVHQIRKGYKLRDRLLRPASVVVAKQPAA